MKSKHLIIAFAILALVILVLVLVPAPQQPPAAQPDPLDTTAWQTFESKTFKFSVKYPSTWTVKEFANDPIAPRINIYHADEIKRPPFDHHSHVSQVSFFPQGVPTEGVFGKYTTSTFRINTETEHEYDFLLDDATVWATILTPVNPPQPWQPGFMWLETNVQNLHEYCVVGGKEVSLQGCDLYSAEKVGRTGTVDAGERAIEEAIIKTFRFTE